MKKLLAYFLLSIVFPLALFGQQLMPQPQKIEFSPGKFRLAKTGKLLVEGTNDYSTIKAADRAAKRFKKLSGEPLGGKVRIHSLVKKGNEEYHLRISQDGIYIVSGGPLANNWAFETLTQLLQKDTKGSYLPYVEIHDFPAFRWRGMMVDVARHFIPMDVMKRNVDAMAAAKMNMLHLHLSDDEGFRIESKVFPKLHQMGSNGKYYTQDEIQDLVKYCSDRGIMVYPEFDLPGHSQSWFAGYPELASEEKVYQPGPRFNVSGDKPLNTMQIMQMMASAPLPTIDPSKESTYEFLDSLIAEMKYLFRSGFIHWGIDESNGVAWKNNPKIVAFMAANNIANTHELQDYFLQRVNKIAKKHDLRSIAWEEAFNEKTPKDVIIQTWKPGMMGPSVGLEPIQKNGNEGILSRGFYLDTFLPAYYHYENKEITQTSAWRGGEAAIWSEIVDENVFEGRVWPRALAIGERLWTNPEKSDVDNMYTRLFHVENYLSKLGLQSSQGKKLAISNNPILKDFLPILTPIRGYKRLMSEMTVPLEKRPTAFTELRDVMPSDSKEAFEFRMKVKAYLLDGKKEPIQKELNKWARINANTIPNLQPLAENLSKISQKTLLFLDNSDSALKQVILDEIKSSRKPSGSLEVGIWDEIEAIVSGQLKDRPTNFPLF